MAEASDPRIRIWNLLHDGELTAIAGEGADTLTLWVSIPYVRRRLAPLGDSFVLTLGGVTRFEFCHFDGEVSTLAAVLDDAGSPEILSTSSESMPLRIETTMGRLELDFRSITFALDSGAAVEFEAIHQAAANYWAEWTAKAEAARKAENSPS